MNYRFGNTIVIALGGSIMYPKEIDVLFLKNFKTFILKRLQNDSRFVIAVGGGRICRIYQEAAAKIAKVTDEDKDWIGIHTTRSNAHLLRTMFRGVADPVVIDSRHKIKKLRYPVTIASGWRPGWSTDYVATALTADFETKEVVIAGKPDFVYDKDFSKHNDAKPIEELSWIDYRKLIPKKWKPGLHAPVDPVAAKLAGQKKIKAIIVNGKDLKNFSNLLSGRDFQGTLIH